MKNILITGCSSGIGLQSALLLKGAGHKVFATARKNEDIEKLNSLGFKSFYLDIEDYKSINNTIKAILKEVDTIDILFNNGAYGQLGAVEDVSVEVLKNQFDTNVFGWHYLVTKIIPIMREQKNGGRIIQHSSVLGIVSLRFRGAYNASKYAIEGLSDTLRLELIGSGIDIVTINTGPVTSDFRKNALKNFEKNIDIDNSHFSNIYKNELQKRLKSVEKESIFTISSKDVAKIVLKIVNSKSVKPRYYITKATYLLGFLKRILSTKALDFILKKI